MTDRSPETIAPGSSPVMRAPLTLLAAGLMAGIAAGRFVPLADWAWVGWLAVAGLASTVLAVAGRRRLATVALIAAVLALGALHFRTQWYRLPDDHIATYTSANRTISSIRGRVADAPAIRSPSSGVGYAHEPVTTFDLAADAILLDGRWRPTCGAVAVTVLAADDRLARGQRVELAGWLSRVARADNPGQYDPAAQARIAGELVRFRVPSPAAATVLAERSGSWPGRVRDAASRWAREKFGAAGDGRAGLLLEALVLGRRDPSLAPLQRAMARAGIAHLMSISGMHLGVFLGFVYLLCRLFGVSRRAAAGAALVALAGYLLLAEPRPALLRSAIMAACVCAGVIMNRPGSVLNALALAAIVLLAAEPAELLSPGFQLSFATVAGLILLFRPMRRLLFGRFLRTRGLRVYRDDQRVRRWLTHRGADFAIDAACASLLAWMVSVPLAAYHFGIVSLLGAPLTLAVAPLVAVALVLGYLGLATAWAPNLSHALISAGAGVADAIVRVVEAFGSLGSLAVETQPVGPLWVLTAWVALVVVLVHRRLWKGRLWAGAAVACLVGATVLTQLPAAAPPMAELHVLDVGAGNCIVLRGPSGRTALLDAGSLGRADCGREILLPFLRNRRLPLPGVVAISHANSDHFNAVGAVVDRVPRGDVYLNETFGLPGDRARGPEAAALMADFDRRGWKVRRLTAGGHIVLDDRTDIEVLWPPPGRGNMEVNDRSLVLRVTCDGTSVLLPGDISDEAQAELARRPGGIRADVLVLPHHGNWRATLPAFVEAVDPKVVVVSSPRIPSGTASGGKASDAFYSSLGRRYRYYTTATKGYIRVRFGKGKVSETTWR